MGGLVMKSHSEYALMPYGAKPQTLFHVFPYDQQSKMGIYGLDIAVDKNLEAHVLITQPHHECDTPIELHLSQIMNHIYSILMQQREITNKTQVHWYFLTLDDVTPQEKPISGVLLRQIHCVRIAQLWKMKDLLSIHQESWPFDLTDFIAARKWN